MKAELFFKDWYIMDKFSSVIKSKVKIWRLFVLFQLFKIRETRINLIFEYDFIIVIIYHKSWDHPPWSFAGTKKLILFTELTKSSKQENIKTILSYTFLGQSENCRTIRLETTEVVERFNQHSWSIQQPIVLFPSNLSHLSSIQCQ